MKNKETINKIEYINKLSGLPFVEENLFERKIKKIRSDRNFMLAIMLVVIIVSAIIMVNSLVFFNVRVSGPSMQPTLYTGDVLIANRYKAVTRGSIVVIEKEKPNSNDWLIKRVIAVEGDTVKITDGYVYLNGEKLEEKYILSEGKTEVESDGEFIVTVAEGEYFYLGDNRENSSDSRLKGFGTCSKNQIVGVIEEWSLSLKNIKRK